MKYSFLDYFYLGYRLICSKLFFGYKVRIIKSKPRILRKGNIVFSEGFTAGYNFRCECVSSDSKIFFGKNVKLNDDVHVGAFKSIIIEDDCLIGSRVTIIDHDHGNYNGSNAHSCPEEVPDERELVGEPIVIGKKVWIGDGAVILKGVHIYKGSVVAANSVVTKSYDYACILAGIPAKPIKKFCWVENKWVNL